MTTNFDVPIAHHLFGRMHDNELAEEFYKYNKFVNFLRNIWDRLLLKTIILLILMILFTYAGENPYEVEQSILSSKELNDNKEWFESSLFNISLICGNETECKTEISIVLHQYNIKTGVETTKVNEYTWKNWLNGVWFASTIYTTIGYGSMAPKTDGGKIFTIVYALFGIPLYIVLLSYLGGVLYVCFKWLYAKVLYLAFKLRGKYLPKDKIRFPLSLFFLIFLVYMFLSALIMYSMDKWSYLDAFYFWFITIATIGFGDMLPESPDYLYVVFILLLFGLALLSMLLAIISERLQDKYLETVRRRTMLQLKRQRAETAAMQQQNNLFTEEGSIEDVDSITTIDDEEEKVPNNQQVRKVTIQL